jgi:hypothetical protein
MPAMTPRRGLTVLVALLALIAVAPPAQAAGGDDAGASKRRSCGTISSTSVYSYARVVAIRRVSCRTARRVAKAYDASGRMLGSWRCALAHSDRPRLFSCGAGGSRGNLRKFPRALEAVGTNRSASMARCGSVSYGGRTYVMGHVRISCPSARRKIRYVHRRKRLPGWECESGTNFRTGGGCTRGRKYFGWHPGD